MTNQQAFDHVSNHLREQGEQALGEDGACRLRAVDGKACSVGCLLDVESYHSGWEDLPLAELQDVSVLHAYPYGLLLGLQLIHDDEDNWLTDPNGFIGEPALRACAKHHGLTYSAPEAGDG